MALRGTYNHSVDAKGRVSLPAKFRKELPDDLTVFPVNDKDLGVALYVFSNEAFDEWIEDFFRKEDGSGYNRRSRKDIRMMHYLNSKSKDVTIDAAGRIKLDPDQCKEAHIENKDVEIIGNLDHIEIWDKQIHEDFLAADEQPFEPFLED